MSEHAWRHAFVQTLDGDRLHEVGLRADAESAARGWVVDAAYLGWSATQRFPWKLFAPLFGVTAARRVHLPFTDDGQDALGLFETTPAPDVVRVTGEVEALADRATVLDDLWVAEPFCRIVELDDFVVIDDDGEPVVVSCGLAPLLVASPERGELRAQREQLSARTVRLLPDDLPHDAETLSLSVRPGMRVEVLGVVRELEASIRRATLEPASAAYRSRARRPLSVIGDEDGTRLVLRVLPAPA
jgi:hypothetical protein